ncbi:MAG: hypothetical protein ACI9JN_001190 [Bacteroidia bacterium]|jgi:hypothetical protein
MPMVHLKHFRHLVLFLALSFGAFQTSNAQNSEKAKKLYEKANKLYKKGKYGEVLPLYKESLEVETELGGSTGLYFCWKFTLDVCPIFYFRRFLWCRFPKLLPLIHQAATRS